MSPLLCYPPVLYHATTCKQTPLSITTFITTIAMSRIGTYSSFVKASVVANDMGLAVSGGRSGAERGVPGQPQRQPQRQSQRQAKRQPQRQSQRQPQRQSQRQSQRQAQRRVKQAKELRRRKNKSNASKSKR